MPRNNITRLHPTKVSGHDCFTGAPIDYPVGARFVEPERVTIPTPMFTGSEIVTVALVSFVVGALFTVLAAFVLSFFL